MLMVSQLIGFGAGSDDPPTTWNPLDKSGTVSLSGGNLIATAGATSTQGVRSTDGRSSGKYYFEMVMTTVGASVSEVIGVADLTHAIGAFVGQNPNGIGLYVNGDIYRNAIIVGTGTAYTSGDVIGIAIDVGAQLIWFRKGSGIWNNNAANNPATATGGLSTGVMGTPVFAAGNVFNSGDIITARFNAALFGFTVPSGFLPWGS